MVRFLESQGSSSCASVGVITSWRVMTSERPFRSIGVQTLKIGTLRGILLISTLVRTISSGCGSPEATVVTSNELQHLP